MQSQTVLETQTKAVGKTLLILGIILVAFNLRPAITSVGPLVSYIRADTGISAGGAGFITTLPLLSFGVLSILAPKFGHRYGNERMVFVGLLVLLFGIVMRSTGLISTLFIGTALVGIGVAIGNVLLPGIIKHRYPEKVGIMTSVYTTSMALLAALGSGFSVALAEDFQLGWRGSLMSWGLLALVAIAIWIPQLKKKSDKPKATTTIQLTENRLWRSTIAWQVTAFMGLQSFLFYCVIAWLPEILVTKGFDLATAGWLLSVMQLCGLPLTFLTPVYAEKCKNQRGIVLAIGALFLLGIGGLLSGANSAILIISVVLIGFGQGANISLALTLLGLRTENAKQAAELSGMAQSGGYILAAIGPFLLGALLDQTHSWTIGLIVLLVTTFLMVAAGLGAGRNLTVFEQGK